MATYYVDPDNGNNANNGLGPDASHGTNKPWATFGKVFSTAASGDLIYFAPGVYREVNTLSQTWTSETILRGDPTNAQGFKDASGVLKASGVVRLTGFTTNDTTAGTASTLLVCTNRDFLTFENIYFEPYRGQVAISMTGGTCNDIKFQQCTIQTSGAYGLQLTLNFGQVANLLVDRCIILTNGGGSTNPISVVHTSGTGADWNPNIDVRNSILFSNGYNPVGYLKSGASANVAGGMDVRNCILIGKNCVDVGNSSLTIPWYFRNNYMLASERCYSGQNTAQVDSDYNWMQSPSGNLNVTLGANDHDTAWSGHIDFGASQLWGLAPGAPPFFPRIGSPLLNSGEGNNLSGDLYNKARPNPNSRGPFEYYPPLAWGSAS